MEITPADIRAMMQAFGWSQRDLTLRLGAGEGTVSHWLKGDRAPKGPHRLTLIKLIAQSKTVGDRPDAGARREELRAMVTRIVAATIPEPPDDATDTQRAYAAGGRDVANAMLGAMIDALWLAQYDDRFDRQGVIHDETAGSPTLHAKAQRARRLPRDAD